MSDILYTPISGLMPVPLPPHPSIPIPIPDTPLPISDSPLPISDSPLPISDSPLPRSDAPFNDVHEDEELGSEEMAVDGKEVEKDTPGRENTDDGSVLVIILRCETKPCNKNIANMKQLFMDNYFIVHECEVDPPESIPQHKNMNISSYFEKYFMIKALKYAHEGPYIKNADGIVEPMYWWTNIPCIIIKDSSVSNVTGTMKNRIQTALERAPDADLFFLCKWQDSCDKHTDVIGMDNNDGGSTLKWSVQPTSTQAIMYTPKSREMMIKSLQASPTTTSDTINHIISRGDLAATVFVPNIIDFDIDLATSDTDYIKLNECITAKETPPTTSTPGSLIWFVVLVILIIIVAWSLIQLGPQYTKRVQ